MLSFVVKNKCLKKKLVSYGKVQLTLQMSRYSKLLPALLENRSFPLHCQHVKHFQSSSGLKETNLMLTKFVKTLRQRGTISGYDNKEYQYLQISKTPTMHFQASLPRLPIPKLKDTCRRYLLAQEPLLSKEEFEKTNLYVSKFLDKDGPSLHKKLLETDSKNRHTSYISEPWFDMYLRDRKPLPINYNPLLVFTQEKDPQYNTQLVKATNLVISSLRFMRSLRDNVLVPEVFHLNPKKSNTERFRTITRLLPPQLSWYGAYLFKAFPLDMSQYHNLFNTTRIPCMEKDKIFQNTKARHLVIMRRGHFYSVDVLDENGYIREPKEIAASLKFILEDNRPESAIPIGVLTTAERDRWARIRSHLSKIGNDQILREIDSAIFLVILDDEIIDNDYHKLLPTFLHADGTNRWFDKSFSLIVSKDGYAGINFEHSWGDGVAVLRFFNEVKADISENPMFHPSDVNHLDKKMLDVRKLEVIVNDKIKSAVANERKRFEEWTNALSIDYMIYNELGKAELKSFGVSPDAIMQLAFQLALYHQEGSIVPTYESCSTAAFKHGRTETIRSCTVQTKETCIAMSKKDKSMSELKRLIINCSNVHNSLTKEAAMGQGFDRHLFVLKKIWERSGTPKPTIFEDPAYERLNCNILSTSTLSSPALLAGGFGPVMENGYGIGYTIQDKALGAVVTSYTNFRSSSDYVKSLREAFNNIHRVLAHR